MTNNDQEKWIEDVLGSMENSQRVQPRLGLLTKIETRINQTPSKTVSLHQWNIAAAAAILLFVLNAYVIQQAVEGSLLNKNSTELIDTYPLVSNYKIYE